MIDKGKVLSGRYEILEQIGSGGFGVVFKARDRQADRLVAVKVLYSHLAEEPAYLRRFHREIIIAKALHSEHAVKTIASGDDGDLHYLVMEFVEGQTLRDLLRQQGALAPQAALEICLGVARALADAHQNGIVHRDVKPHNIFVTPNGVKLGDFGIARADDIMSQTVQTGYLGTVAYSSPEQVRGEELGVRSDIYALGVVLYEMLAGRPPFAGSPLSVMDAHLHRQAERLEGAPTAVNALLQKCLAKRPEDRFQTTDELCAAIEGVATRATGVMEASDTHTIRIETEEKTAPWPSAERDRRSGRPPKGPGFRGILVGGFDNRRWMLATIVATVAVSVAGGIVAAILLTGGSGGTNNGMVTSSAPALPTGPPLGFTFRPFENMAYVNSSDGDIWLIDPDGDGTTHRITTAGNTAHPAWSPDGLSLAYVRHVDGQSSIWVWDSGLNQETSVLGPVSALIRSPVWEPNGDAILYHEEGNLDGVTTRIRRHLLSSGTGTAEDTTIIGTVDGETTSLAGFDVLGSERLVLEFTKADPGVEVADACGISIYDRQSGSATYLIQPDSGRCYGRPAVSPDGQSVALIAYPGDGKGYIAIIGTDGQGYRQLAETSLRSAAEHPLWPKIAWSGDSQYVFYESVTGDTDSILFRELAASAGNQGSLPIVGRHPVFAYTGRTSLSPRSSAAALALQPQPPVTQSLDPQTTFAQSGSIAMTVNGARFSPNKLGAALGEEVTIRLMNSVGVPHSLRIAGIDGKYDTEDDRSTGTMVLGEQLFSLTLTVAGDYTFRCDFHPESMGGQIVAR